MQIFFFHDIIYINVYNGQVMDYSHKQSSISTHGYRHQRGSYEQYKQQRTLGKISKNNVSEAMPHPSLHTRSNLTEKQQYSMNQRQTNLQYGKQNYQNPKLKQDYRTKEYSHDSQKYQEDIKSAYNKNFQTFQAENKRNYAIYSQPEPKYSVTRTRDPKSYDQRNNQAFKNIEQKRPNRQSFYDQPGSYINAEKMIKKRQQFGYKKAENYLHQNISKGSGGNYQKVYEGSQNNLYANQQCVRKKRNEQERRYRNQNEQIIKNQENLKRKYQRYSMVGNREQNQDINERRREKEFYRPSYENQGVTLSQQNTPNRQKNTQNNSVYTPEIQKSHSRRQLLISKSKMLREKMNELSANKSSQMNSHRTYQVSEKQKSPSFIENQPQQRIARLRSRPQQRLIQSPYRQKVVRKYERYSQITNANEEQKQPNNRMRRIDLFKKEEQQAKQQDKVNEYQKRKKDFTPASINNAFQRHDTKKEGFSQINNFQQGKAFQEENRKDTGIISSKNMNNHLSKKEGDCMARITMLNSKINERINAIINSYGNAEKAI